MTDELLKKYKDNQLEGWSLFAPLDVLTTIPAALLVEFSQLKSGHSVLDIGCGTGVVSITAARLGAIVSGCDISPILLEKAKHNTITAKVAINFQEADVESLPYPDDSFDVVISQFGHMFATNAQLAINEMLRVLKPGGIIAFSTWPPEHFVGKVFALVSQYNPSPISVDSPYLWGAPEYIKKKLHDRVNQLIFDYDVMYLPALSLEHYQQAMEKSLGPIVKFIERVGESAAELRRFREELKTLAENYYQNNYIRQTFLMTRGIKN